MPDHRAQKILSRGFWKGSFYIGILRFGIPAAVLLTVIGLMWNGTQTFELAWWRKGTVGFLLGGFVWFASLWLVARLPLLFREVICWGLAFGIGVFVAVVLIHA